MPNDNEAILENMDKLLTWKHQEQNRPTHNKPYVQMNGYIEQTAQPLIHSPRLSF